MNRQAEHDIRRKTKVLDPGKQSGHVSHAQLEWLCLQELAICLVAP